MAKQQGKILSCNINNSPRFQGTAEDRRINTNAALAEAYQMPEEEVADIMDNLSQRVRRAVSEEFGKYSLNLEQNPTQRIYKATPESSGRISIGQYNEALKNITRNLGITDCQEKTKPNSYVKLVRHMTRRLKRALALEQEVKNSYTLT